MLLFPKWTLPVYCLCIIYTKETYSQSANETVALTNRSAYDTIVTDKDDVAIYEMDNFETHLRNAESKSDAYEVKLNNTLRYLAVDKHEAANLKYMYFANTSIGLMQQSIYATRDRLRETRKFRQTFAEDPTYRGAMIYASLMQLRTKMDNILATMRNMKSDRNFIHVLTLYERMIVASVDVETFVNQMFEIQEIFKDLYLKSNR